MERETETTQISYAEIKGCKNKKHFDSRTSARKKSKELKRFYKWKHKIYRCKFCDGYHLTTAKE